MRVKLKLLWRKVKVKIIRKRKWCLQHWGRWDSFLHPCHTFKDWILKLKENISRLTKIPGRCLWKSREPTAKEIVKLTKWPAFSVISCWIVTLDATNKKRQPRWCWIPWRTSEVSRWPLVVQTSFFHLPDSHKPWRPIFVNYMYHFFTSFEKLTLPKK